MLDLRKLRMLTELERLGSVAQVAASLHLAAPGISIQLAQLEREVGLRLTERIGRGIILTPAGKLLASHGRSILGLVTVAEMEARALKDGAAGKYRVATFPTAARSIVSAAWRQLIAAPQSDIELQLLELEPREALSALEAGEVELAVVHSYSNMPPVSARGVIATEILVEPVRLALSSSDPRAAQGTVTLADFAGDPWVVPHPETTCHEMGQRACSAAGFSPNAVAQSTDFGVQLELVDAGAGVALIPYLGTLQAPEGITLLELEESVFRYDLVLTREASGGDAGLLKIAELIAVFAQELAVEMR